MTKKRLNTKDVVMKRTAILAPILSLNPSKEQYQLELRQKIKEVALENNLSANTVKNWLKRYQADATHGLCPRYRGSNTKAATNQQVHDCVEKLCELRVANEYLSVQDLIDCLESEHPNWKGLLKRSTAQRYLQAKGLSKADLANTEKLAKGKYYNRFQHDEPLDLVQGDIKYGPSSNVYDEDGLLVKVYLVAWIDDRTRKILSAGFFTNQMQYAVNSTMRALITKYGRPRAVYMDNGKVYVSHSLSFIFKSLGIKEKHAPIRAAAAKGKIERFNRTIDSLFNQIKAFPRISFNKCNELCQAWIEDYNNKVHSALNGKTPNEVFNALYDKQRALFPPAELMDSAFLTTTMRKIKKDGTISVFGKTWVIPDHIACVHSEVEVITARTGAPLEAPELLLENLSSLPLKELTMNAYGNRGDSPNRAKPDYEVKEENKGALLKKIAREKQKAEGSFTTEEEFQQQFASELEQDIKVSPAVAQKQAKQKKKAHKKEQGAGTTSTAATTTASNLSTTLSRDPLDVFSTLTSKESQA